MSVFSQGQYYVRSIGTLLTGLDQPLRTLAMFLGWPELLPAEIRLRHTGWRFKVRSAMDVWIIKETCLDQDYLKAKVALEPHWTVVDIGAGLGDFTVFAAKHCVRGVVHAYEPLPESFALLQHNLQLNGVNNVQSFSLAVSARASLLAPETRDAAAVSTRFVKRANEEGAATASLLQILDALPGGRCDFMKIDCEGCEYDLLLNSPPALLARIDRLSLEYHNHATIYTGLDLASFLKQQGYDVELRANPVHAYLGFLFAQRPSAGRQNRLSNS
jgi:FkbM family methyltransferase